MTTRNLKQFPVIDFSKCIQCGKCLKICPSCAIIDTDSNICDKCIKYCITMKVPCNPGNHTIIYEKCDSCGKCIEICEAMAIYWFVPEKVR